MQAEEVDLDVDLDLEIDVAEVDVLEGSAPLEPMQVSASRGSKMHTGRDSTSDSDMRREARLCRLMPYTLTLSVQDVAQCEIVENEAFPPHERASRDKVRTAMVQTRLRDWWCIHVETWKCTAHNLKEQG